MATYGWGKNRSVADGLFEEGHRFSFYQAVRLLERIFPRRTPVAEGVDPEREVVHFRSAVGHGFPPSEVVAVERDGAPEHPATMTVSFLGLAGVNGPLPRAFTDLVIERTFRGDTGVRDFLDVFNHRLVSIFYRGRKKYRPPLGHEPPNEGRVARTLFALIGLGTPHLPGRLEVEDRSLLPYVGFLMGRRSMVGLERFLSDYFGFPVRAEPFRGTWHRLEAHQLTRIGLGGQNQVLGQSAVLGERVWDQQAGFEVVLGPLTLRQMLDVLPTARGFPALCALVTFYAGDELDFHLRFVLRRAEIPELRLGQAGDARLGWSARFVPGKKAVAAAGAARPELRLGRTGDARLGWTTWLPGRAENDDGVVVVRGKVRRIGDVVTLEERTGP